MPRYIDIRVTKDDYDRLLAESEEPVAVAAIDPSYIKAIRRFPPLSETELIEQVIEFANSGKASAHALLWSSVSLPERALAAAEAQESPKDARPGRLPLIERERLALCDDLALIVAGKVTSAIGDSWRRRAAGLVMLPTYSDDGCVRYRYAVFEQFALPPMPPLAYAQLLLLSRPQNTKLCQCKLAGCGRFFLAARPTTADRKGERRGRTIRDYCPGTDHRELAHQAAAVERMRSSRERAKVRATMKQKRRR